jgi:hypothetical protein
MKVARFIAMAAAIVLAVNAIRHAGKRAPRPVITTAHRMIHPSPLMFADIQAAWFTDGDGIYYLGLFGDSPQLPIPKELQ